MLHRILFIVWCIGASILLTNTFNNNGIPLGFDHGAYRHFIHMLLEKGSIKEIPLYLQQQFEPFSGPFFFTLFQGIPENYLFSWGYSALYILISISLFILGKKNGKYTAGSYFGLFLFIFSVLQYVNFWWSFGKQMFATLFLILFIKYHKKISIGILLLSACIALHRLTGFIAILFAFFSFLGKNKTPKWPFILALFLGIFTYSETFFIQVFPYFLGKVHNYIFLSGNYGTGLPQLYSWLYEIPLIILIIFVFRKSKYRFKKKDTHIILLAIIAFMVVFRCIAHTRLESFLDLFLIIFVVKNYVKIDKKALCIIILAQFIVGLFFIQKWHTSFVDKNEQRIIENTFQKIPKDVSIVTLTGAYMSMITPYTNNEIYSTYQGIGGRTFNKGEIAKMRSNKAILCKNLSLLPNKVFVYVGAREKFTSTLKNPCLDEIKTWSNKAKLLFYNGKR